MRGRGTIIILFSIGYMSSFAECSESHHIEKRWADFPNVTFTFDCTDRPIGFYADVEHDCMIFHMCDEDGRRIPYMCANETSFNQKFRVCDWNYNVDCASSPDWFYLNDLTYRTDPPPTSTSAYNVRRKKSQGSKSETEKNEKAELTLSEDVELRAPSVKQFERDSESLLKDDNSELSSDIVI